MIRIEDIKLLDLASKLNKRFTISYSIRMNKKGKYLWYVSILDTHIIRANNRYGRASAQSVSPNEAIMKLCTKLSYQQLVLRSGSKYRSDVYCTKKVEPGDLYVRVRRFKI